jgi:hypothetical protein
MTGAEETPDDIVQRFIRELPMTGAITVQIGARAMQQVDADRAVMIAAFRYVCS